MAETAPLPFAVDTDIAPLQGQYFESVAQNVSDPRLRSQLYDKVRATFGGIQQARDIQRAKAQEEEDRSLSLEVRRAQLDQNRMELGAARDKVRKQQEAAAKGMAFNSAMSELEPALRQASDPEKARAALYGVAAQFSDVLSELPAAQTRLTLLDKSLAGTKKANYRDIKTLAQLRDDLQAEKLMPGSTQTSEYQAEKALATQKYETAALKKQQAVDSAIAAGAQVAAKNLQGILDPNQTLPFDEIDQQLRDLDAAGYVNPELKAKLKTQGIYALEAEPATNEVKQKAYGEKSAEKVSPAKQIALLKQVAASALTQAARKGIDLAKKAPAEIPAEPESRAVEDELIPAE